MYLIVVGEVIVGDGDCSWAHDSINKAIGTIREWIVVDPYMAWPKDGNGIAISHGSPPKMSWRASHHGISCGLAIMDVKTVDNDIGHKLYCDASAIGDVYIDPASINGLKTVHDEFLFQLNHHVPFEYDPKRFLLNDSMTKSPWLRVHRIVVAWISDNVETTITTTDSIPAEPNATFS